MASGLFQVIVILRECGRRLQGVKLLEYFTTTKLDPWPSVQMGKRLLLEAMMRQRAFGK